VPFAVRGRPLHELALYGPAKATLSAEQFEEAVTSCDGEVFGDEERYVSHLSARLFGTADSKAVVTLAERLREVRNPTLLGDVSTQAAAAALRESLPGVAEDVVTATADALAESDATRDAFDRDRQAAEVLADFRDVWCGHVTEVVSVMHAAAMEAARDLRAQAARVKKLAADRDALSETAATARVRVDEMDEEITTLRGELGALKEHEIYREAGRLQELKKVAGAQRHAAITAVGMMETTARGVAAAIEALRGEIQGVSEDVLENQGRAREADPDADDGSPLLWLVLRPRGVLRAGDVVADPGPELVVQGSVEGLRAAATSWRKRAEEYRLKADAAGLAVLDHKQVETLQSESDRRRRDAQDADSRADLAVVTAKQADGLARDAVRGLLNTILSWIKEQRDFASPGRFGSAQEQSEGQRTFEDISQLFDAEAGDVLDATDAWGRDVVARAEELAADLRAQAKREEQEAAQLGETARSLRIAAKELREGRLLPLPRPEWAGPGDDVVALGAVIDWRDREIDSTEKALVEAAMAASGILGATVTEAGATTTRWSVTPNGPVVVPNLGEVIAVDPAHPLASLASEIIVRIGLASTLADVPEAGAPFTVGRDGTFGVGVLRGRVPGADDPEVLVPATHIGARRRREAALARAAVLEAEAAEAAERQAMLVESSEKRREDAAAISAAGRSFPSREVLRRAELKRAETARLAATARELAAAARFSWETASEALKLEKEDWSLRTRGRGLPPDLGELVRLNEEGAKRAKSLQDAAAPLHDKLAMRLERAIGRLSGDETRAKLSGAEGAAQEACRLSAETESQVRTLEETAGAAIAEVLARYQDADRRLTNLNSAIATSRNELLEKTRLCTAAQAHLEAAETKLRDEMEPNARAKLVALGSILQVPGVSYAVLDGEAVDAADLVARVGAKLEGRKKLTQKTLLERFDAARAKLAGVWSVDHGNGHEALLTFVLTYRDEIYTPIDAAAVADTLKARAEQALAASEEKALRDFVVGRLPSAIATAWTRLQDWKAEVNAKMRAAAASSGVGVQVQIPLKEADELSAASRTVYELCCKISDAERTHEQAQLLGAALKSLLDGTSADTMQERVASAVDIRQWVDVHYDVIRPGGKTQRWTSRTGLSSGERRLVVLAPMLAAVAAFYDRMAPTALRLVTLDEVPAEVDERGREGLARYVAQLDLDLVCTSHLWDGCPGAWDGIDAHDLEAGSDGTVVAFPMLVRGLSSVPEIADQTGTSSGFSAEPST
jgi:hypothetical protein